MEKLTFEFINSNIPKLGFGMMRMPKINNDDKKIDIARAQEMVDYYMDNGMNYFDTAYFYHGGASELCFKETVSSRYARDKYFVADKMPIWEAKEKSDVERIFNDQLDKCGVSYFDFYLHHALNVGGDKKSDEFGAYDFCKQMKKEGKIKYLGFSFHDTPEVLEDILSRHPEMEFVQLQINYLDWNGPLRSNEYYAIAQKYNLPIIVMEPVRGGLLANLPERIASIIEDKSSSVASLSLRFCASLDGILTILSGMSDMQQLQDNVKTFTNFKPLSPAEDDLVLLIAKKLAQIETIGCTDCKYCIDCPVNIDIPKNFAIANQFALDNDYAKVKEGIKQIDEAKRINKCTACGLCESVCPQQLKIPQLFKDISRAYSLQ